MYSEKTIDNHKHMVTYLRTRLYDMACRVHSAERAAWMVTENHDPISGINVGTMCYNDEVYKINVHE